MFVVLEIVNGECFFEAEIDKYDKVAVVTIEKLASAYETAVSEVSDASEQQQETTDFKSGEQADIDSEL